MIPPEWRAREVAVIGLGRSGAAAARFLRTHDVSVYASDAGTGDAIAATAAELQTVGVAVEAGRHDLARIGRAAAVVVSPGVPPGASPLQAAREAGVEVVAELDLAARALGGSTLLAVTGTNGKTTTTALVAHLLRADGRRAVAAGNIGRPLSAVAMEADPPGYIAVEASSFQLHDAPRFTPDVGVVTNLAPDHLDRYPDVEAYYADKRLLFRNAVAGSVWVLNGDDPGVEALAPEAAGRRRRFSCARQADAWLDRAAGRLMLGREGLVSRAELQLLGEHNVANALAASLAVEAVGVARGAIEQGLRSFAPLPHRLEPLGTVAGRRWVNDSKATNPASTAVAIAAMDEPYVLILGGRAKGGGFARLAPLLGERCRAVVAYGEAREQLAEELRGVTIHGVPEFDAAVGRAAELAGPGDTVLLAPACASFDQFHDYEERGERFRALAQAR